MYYIKIFFQFFKDNNNNKNNDDDEWNGAGNLLSY